MDQQDREAIEGLFERIARVAQRSGPRDRGAEAFIRAQIDAQPEAPYYMAQTIIVQEQALNAAQERIEQLEQQLQGGEQPGGFMGGLFGSRNPATRSRYADVRRDISPWGGGQGGFLAGAAQTAMGVAGGVVLGNMLADWLTPDPASAEDVAADGSFGDQPGDAGQVDVADAGGGFGDFDFGDF